jgi:hypothetical protein
LGFALYGTKERGEERRGEKRRRGEERRGEEKRREEKRGGLAITFHCKQVGKTSKKIRGTQLVSDDDDDDDDNGVLEAFLFLFSGGVWGFSGKPLKKN